MKRYTEVAASYGRRHFDLLGAALILAIALALRLIDLGSVSSNLTADELNDLQNAYRVIYGQAGGFFGLDWNQSPNLNMYLKAASIQVFGDSIAGTRMYSVVLSMAALVAFYPLARRRLDPLPALASLFLLATSLWFLHFSRTPWVAMSSVLAAVMAAYLLDLALEKQKLWLFALLGAAVAFGAYGYFGGRTLVFVVAACYFIACWLQPKDVWSLTKGFALAGVVAFVLFAPQLKTLLEDWEYANTRPRAVSVLNVEGEYLGDSNRGEIILHQTLRAARGFLLLDKSVTEYGLWARHRPADWAFIDQATGLLYWAGLTAGVFYWRKYLYWWAFLLIPLFFTQVFSVGTPDGSRGLMAAPLMFLFVGLGIQTLLSLVPKPTSTPGQTGKRANGQTPYLTAGRWLPGVVVVLALAIGAFNADRYFDWMKEPGALAARQPAIAGSEFHHFRTLAREMSREGQLVSEEAWLRYRRMVLGPEAQ
ncbi:MAG: hypothetical protein GEU75_00750 [Dehalococcoidia bacterium]|nr:hypothetical protein [Dehalococcoidia bacterium]